jgi:hypothetical protein
MLPTFYQLPAALVLLIGGIVACFFGYRMFRLVLAIFGFILGALASSSVFGPSDTTWMVGAAIVGGLLGAGILFAAYFVAVALVGAGLGAVVAHVAFSASGSDPHFLAILFCAVAGAVASTYLQRYVVILATGFGGALTLMHGVLGLVGTRMPVPGLGGDGVWAPYPLDPLPGRPWASLAWLVVGVIGSGVQLGWTGGEKGRVGRRRRKQVRSEA